eukprot:IDg5411t1
MAHTVLSSTRTGRKVSYHHIGSSTLLKLHAFLEHEIAVTSHVVCLADIKN